MLEAILGWLLSRASHLAQHQQAGSKQDTFGELVLPRKGHWQAKVHSDYSFSAGLGRGRVSKATLGCICMAVHNSWGDCTHLRSLT